MRYEVYEGNSLRWTTDRLGSAQEVALACLGHAYIIDTLTGDRIPLWGLDVPAPNFYFDLEV